MKKILAVLLTTVFLLTGCSENSTSVTENPDRYDPFEMTGNVSQTTEKSEKYDPFARPDDGALSEKESTVGAFSFGIEWEDGKEQIDYAPTVSFPYYVENGGKATDFGLLIFVNGFRQPYRTEESSENKLMHIFDVNENEKKLQTIEFEPLVGEMGSELSVEIISMFQPEFINIEKSNYEFSHKISSIFPLKLSVTQETGLSEPKVCNDYTSEEVTEEMRQKFNTVGSTGSFSGENSLDSRVFIETLKNDIFLTPADLLAGKHDRTSFTMDDTVTLCMYGGEPCKYRVSMYINHDLVSGAFDGADYIDITSSSDFICTKKIDLNMPELSLEDYNHLYFIAVPFYVNDNFEKRMVIKSSSVTLDNTKQKP